VWAHEGISPVRRPEQDFARGSDVTSYGELGHQLETVDPIICEQPLQKPRGASVSNALCKEHGAETDSTRTQDLVAAPTPRKGRHVLQSCHPFRGRRVTVRRDARVVTHWRFTKRGTLRRACARPSTGTRRPETMDSAAPGCTQEEDCLEGITVPDVRKSEPQDRRLPGKAATLSTGENRRGRKNGEGGRRITPAGWSRNLGLRKQVGQDSAQQCRWRGVL